jgi:hypothetical protein
MTPVLERLRSCNANLRRRGACVCAGCVLAATPFREVSARALEQSLPQPAKTVLALGRRRCSPVLAATVFRRAVHRPSPPNCCSHPHAALRIRDVRRFHVAHGFRHAVISRPQSSRFTSAQLYSACSRWHSLIGRNIHGFITMKPNQALERIAARCVFTFQMTKTVSVEATLALGGGRSACSR